MGIDTDTMTFTGAAGVALLQGLTVKIEPDRFDKTRMTIIVLNKNDEQLNYISLHIWEWFTAARFLQDTIVRFGWRRTKLRTTLEDWVALAAVITIILWLWLLC